MTIATTRGTEMTVDQIVLRAYQLVGLINVAQGTTSPQWEQRAGMGRVLLDTILDELQSEGVYARSVTFFDQPLVIGTSFYDMPSTAIDLIGDGMYIDPTNTDLTQASGETIVKQIDRSKWQQLSTKGASGRPTLYFPNRENTPIEVRLWPVPDEAGHIRFQLHQAMADTLKGDVTIELRIFWIQYILFELAHQLALANSLDVARCSYFNKRAKEKKDRARAYANERTGGRIHMAHRTAWSSRRH